MFLHKQGYSFFTIPRLTYQEIMLLVDGWNDEMREKEREEKRQARLSQKRKGKW